MMYWGKHYDKSCLWWHKDEVFFACKPHERQTTLRKKKTFLLLEKGKRELNAYKQSMILCVFLSLVGISFPLYVSPFFHATFVITTFCSLLFLLGPIFFVPCKKTNKKIGNDSRVMSSVISVEVVEGFEWSVVSRLKAPWSTISGVFFLKCLGRIYKIGNCDSWVMKVLWFFKKIFKNKIWPYSRHSLMA